MIGNLFCCCLLLLCVVRVPFQKDIVVCVPFPRITVPGCNILFIFRLQLYAPVRWVRCMLHRVVNMICDATV